MLECRLGDPEHRRDIDIEGAHPLLVRDFFQRFVRHLKRGVIDQNIDASKPLHCLVHDVLALLFLRKITRQQQALAPGLLHQLGGALRIFVLIQIGDGDIRAFASKSNRHGAANTAVTSSDQRDLAGQAITAFVAFFATIRAWIHLLLQARHCLMLVGKRRTRIGLHVGSPNR